MYPTNPSLCLRQLNTTLFQVVVMASAELRGTVDQSAEGARSEGINFTPIGSLLITGNSYVVPMKLDQETLINPLIKFQAELSIWFTSVTESLKEQPSNTSSMLLDRVTDDNTLLFSSTQDMINEVMDALQSDTQHDPILQDSTRATCECFDSSRKAKFISNLQL